MQKIISPIEFDESLIGQHIDFSTSVYFNIPGKPRGKERPRTRRFKNFITTYTPKNTVEYENCVRNSYKNSVGNVKLQDAIEADILAIFEPPKSTSNKEKQRMIDGKVRYTKKSDCDNIAKVVLDALNNIAYNDDSQICDLHVKKIYGEEPKVRVILRQV